MVSTCHSERPSLIDIGVNLTNSRFDKDRAEVIAKAQAAGVAYQIVTGTNAQESQAAFELSQKYSGLFATAGCHPHDSQRMTDEDFAQIESLLTHDTVVAVGECGLDFNRNFSPPEIQQQVFRQHLKLACDIQKPLFLHERDATETMLTILSDYHNRLPAAVIHCFTANQKALESYLDFGLYIGITGWVCDERRGQELASIVHLIPDNRLMLETDAPYLIPRDLTPKPKSNRNLPQYLPHIAQQLARLRGQSFETLAALTQKNSMEFFNLKPKTS